MVAEAAKPVDLGTASSRARVPQRGPLVPLPGGTTSQKTLLRRCAPVLEEQLNAATNTSSCRKKLSRSALHIQLEETKASLSAQLTYMRPGSQKSLFIYLEAIKSEARVMLRHCIHGILPIKALPSMMLTQSWNLQLKEELNIYSSLVESNHILRNWNTLFYLYETQKIAFTKTAKIYQILVNSITCH